MTASIVRGLSLMACTVLISAHVLPAPAHAQKATETITNLGLRVPTTGGPTTNRIGVSSDLQGLNATRPQLADPGTGMVIMAPIGAGNMQGLGVPLETTSAMPYAATRILANPVVANNNVGFFNSSETTLSFSLETNGASRIIQLAPRQVLTVEVDLTGDIAGTIGTGATHTAMPFARGAIYVLRANAGQWVFAKL